MKTGSIALLDILGFKGIWQTRNPNDVLKILSGVSSVAETVYQTNIKNQKDVDLSFVQEKPRVITLSDSIVIIIESKEPKSLVVLAAVINELFFYFAQQAMFFRGAMTFGSFLHQENTFIGPAIDDVASWYEAANWIGVQTTPKTSYYVDRSQALVFTVKTGSNPCFIKYDVPLKGVTPKLSINCLNWPFFIETRFQGVPERECAAQKMMAEWFSKQSPFDHSVFEKYENTLKFVDYWYKNYSKNLREAESKKDGATET